ncbi:LysM peptidoglycan-binding domain-containing protein [candidate division KSB1 bacterium]|nr:LysM peptidoglycan-binding domain-containing protein [candidate division KSB1 bacterium]
MGKPFSKTFHPYTLLIFLLALGSVFAEIKIVDSSIHEKTAEPGETYQGVFFVKNTSEKPVQLKVYQANYQAFFELDDNEGDDTESVQGSNTEWITFKPLGVVVRPRATIGINYTVKVPSVNELAGTYRSVIVVERISTGADEDLYERVAAKMITHVGNGASLVIKSNLIGGLVKGRVFDRETNKGVPHVILRINEAIAVTDRRGNFIFDSLKPGKYSFTADKVSLPRDKTTVERNPRSIDILNGEETFLSVALTGFATLTGKVNVYPFGKEQPSLYASNEHDDSGIASEEKELAEGFGLGGALVVLSNGSETKRRRTDESGQFTFTNLPQGKWRISVKDKYLPANHHLDENSVEVNVLSGQENHALVGVLPGKKIVSPALLFAEADVKKKANVENVKLPQSRPPQPKKSMVRVSSAKAEQSEVKRYIVRSGDWLSTIAEKFYGDAMNYSAIFAANKDVLENPNKIYPGQELRIPHVVKAKQYYTVRFGDSLSQIAESYYGDAMKYKVVFAANQDIVADPNKIYPGQRLEIPDLLGNTENYTVRLNDWLSKIAKRAYGDASKYRKIYAANRGLIQDPNLIYPGQNLRIPSGTISGRASSSRRIKPGVSDSL